MRPTFLGFETQKRTLQLSQKHIDIVGNNISNINTPGYTRQRVDIYAAYLSSNRDLRWNSENVRLSMAGQGVAANGVAQIRDIYIDKRYRENVAVEAETTKAMEVLTDIEDALDNFENKGLQYWTQQFFNSLQDYAGEKPDSTEVAKICTNTALNVCRLLNFYDQKLKEIETTYVTELQDKVQYIDNMFEQMNNLNQKIFEETLHYPVGYGPNELHDEMNLMIDELATYGNVDVTKHTDGTYTIKMGTVTVVDGQTRKTNRIIMEDYDKYGEAILFFEGGQDLNIVAGELHGYLNLINGNGVYATGHQNSYYGIAYFQSAVDEFARTFAKTFNEANYADIDEFRTMFEPATPGALITAGNIRVAEGWVADPTMIGQARILDEMTGLYSYGYNQIEKVVDGKVTLQNSNVLYLISQFDNQNIKFGNCRDFQGSIYEYISFISNRLGQTIDYEKSLNDTAIATVDTLLDARDEVSAVDFDEEGINMLNYQKWYNASSRIVTALDDLLDKLINGTGRVGL